MATSVTGSYSFSYDGTNYSGSITVSVNSVTRPAIGYAEARLNVLFSSGSTFLTKTTDGKPVFLDIRFGGSSDCSVSSTATANFRAGSTYVTASTRTTRKTTTYTSTDARTETPYLYFAFTTSFHTIMGYKSLGTNDLTINVPAYDDVAPTLTLTRTNYNTITASATDSGGAGLASSPYYWSTSSTTPSASASDWTSTATKTISSSAKETWYCWAKDKANNISSVKSIPSYKVTTSLSNASLSAKYDSASGTAATFPAYVLSGTPMYVTATPDTGFKDPVIMFGSTVVQSGSYGTITADTTITVTAVEDKTGFMYVNVNGTEKKATPYLRLNGSWVRTEAHARVNGEWKKGKA